MNAPGEHSSRRRRWPWLVCLVVVGVIAWFVVRIALRLQDQLTPQRLEDARQFWEANKPADYVLSYFTRVNLDGKRQHYRVEVKGGRVVRLFVNGQEETKDLRLLNHYGMDRLFQDMQTFLEIDKLAEKQGRRSFASAKFDRTDGHLLRYERRALGTEKQVEIIVERFEK